MFLCLLDVVSHELDSSGTFISGKVPGKKTKQTLKHKISARIHTINIITD